MEEEEVTSGKRAAVTWAHTAAILRTDHTKMKNNKEAQSVDLSQPGEKGWDW